MIHDKILTKLCEKQAELFEHGTMAQKENVLMQIEERQKELKRMNGGNE